METIGHTICSFVHPFDAFHSVSFSFDYIVATSHGHYYCFTLETIKIMPVLKSILTETKKWTMERENGASWKWSNCWLKMLTMTKDLYNIINFPFLVQNYHFEYTESYVRQDMLWAYGTRHTKTSKRHINDTNKKNGTEKISSNRPVMESNWQNGKFESNAGRVMCVCTVCVCALLWSVGL